MLFGRTIALVAVVALVAGPAAAAAKRQAHRPGDAAHAKTYGAPRVPRAAPAPSPPLNSESPELTGGGSLGHNEMKGW